MQKVLVLISLVRSIAKLLRLETKEKPFKTDSVKTEKFEDATGIDQALYRCKRFSGTAGFALQIIMCFFAEVPKYISL